MSGPGPTGDGEGQGTVAAAGPDSPDAFGREMAEGPAAVKATLAQVERSRPGLDGAVAVADGDLPAARKALAAAAEAFDEAGQPLDAQRCRDGAAESSRAPA